MLTLEIYKKEWIVYSKALFSSAEYVLQYLGRYTHRVAISDNRIIKVDNEKVVFKWRDYKNKEKVNKFLIMGRGISCAKIKKLYTFRE